MAWSVTVSDSCSVLAVTATVGCAGSCHPPRLGGGFSLLRGQEGALVHRRPLPGTWFTQWVALLCCCSTFVVPSWKEGTQQEPWGPVEGLSVLELLIEQPPGRSRALKTVQNLYFCSAV